MSRLRSATIAVLLTVLLVFPSPVSAQVDPISGLTVGVLIDRMEQSVKSIVDKAGIEARQTVMVAAQQAMLAIQNLKIAYDDSMQKTFGQLNQTERNAFADVNRLISELDTAVDRNLNTVGGIVGQLDAAVARLPFAKNDPRVFRYSPVYHVDLGAAQNIPVVVHGALIGTGSPVLTLAGQTYAAAQRTDGQLTFLVPASILTATQGSITTRSANLRVQRENSSWFGLKRTLEPKSYALLFYAIPRRLGTYRVNVVRDVQKTLRENIRVPNDWFEIRSDWFDGRSNHRFAVGTGDGWLIDTTTIVWHQHHNNHGSYGGIRNASPSGFCVELSANPFGSYSKTLGIKANRGHISGHVTFDRYKQVTERVQAQVATADLLWGRAVTIELPSDTVGFSFAMDQIDGTTISTTKSENEQMLRIDYNPVTKHLSLQPKPVDVALRR